MEDPTVSDGLVYSNLIGCLEYYLVKHNRLPSDEDIIDFPETTSMDKKLLIK